MTEHQTRFWGSFEVDAGTTLRVEWSADREVTIAILNEVDYQEDHSWTIIFRQAESISQSGSLEFPVKNSDKFYVAVQPPITIDARLYTISAKVMSGSTDSFLQNIPIEILFGVIIASVVTIAVLITIILRKRKKK